MNYNNVICNLVYANFLQSRECKNRRKVESFVQRESIPNSCLIFRSPTEFYTNDTIIQLYSFRYYHYRFLGYRIKYCVNKY